MSQLTMRRTSLDGLPAIPQLPPGYLLRDCRTEDRDGLARLMARAFDDPNWDGDRVDRDLLHDPSVHRTLVIVFGRSPVATASIQLLPDTSPGTGIVHWVASDPFHRGKKLGYIVSLAVLLACAELGLKDASLLTDDDRLPAIRTYLSLGFEPACLDETHPARWEAVLAALDVG